MPIEKNHYKDVSMCTDTCLHLSLTEPRCGIKENFKQVKNPIYKTI